MTREEAVSEVSEWLEDAISDRGPVVMSNGPRLVFKHEGRIFKIKIDSVKAP